jgi:hypothetical protein
MPRPLAWLILTVALSGPMLTHAEAAEDLARVLIGATAQGEIETPDGGVGDDPNVASVWRLGPSVDPSPCATPAWDSPPSLAPPGLAAADPVTRRGGRRRRASLPVPTTAPERAAWLQVFRN